jgi:hypothetical protein
MARYILLGGVLALLAVGATTLAKVPKPAVSTSRANRSGDIDHAPANISGRHGGALSGRPPPRSVEQQKACLNRSSTHAMHDSG